MKNTDGIVIKIYKDVQENNDKTNIRSGAMSGVPDIIWSYFDRISIQKVDKMEQFLNMESDTEFVGRIQSFHLYKKREVNEKNVFLFRTDSSENNSLLTFRDGGKKPAFFAITSIRYNSAIHTYMEKCDLAGAGINAKIVKDITLKINKRVNKDEDFKIDIFSSLGDEDLVAVMAANRLAVLCDVVEFLKSITFKLKDGDKENVLSLLETTHTIVGINNHDEAKGYAEEKGILANVRLTLKNNKDGKRYLDNVRSVFKENKEKSDSEKELCTIHQMFGQHDAFIVLPINGKFINQYKSASGSEVAGIFCAENIEYRRAVYQSQTSILYQKEINTTYPLEESINNELLTHYERNIGKIQQEKVVPVELDEFIKIVDKSSLNFDPVLKSEFRIFFLEYQKNINSAFCEQWHEDLNQQMQAFVGSLRVYLLNLDKAERKSYHVKTIVDCMESLKETYDHIAGESRNVLNRERQISYYHGSYNNIMKAYYGIIKRILLIGTIIPKYGNDNEKDIAISVNFDITANVHSELYFLSKQFCNEQNKENVDSKTDKLLVETGEGKENKSSAKALVSFNLPYGALVDVPKYIPYLIHEVFHYVTPVNRVNRNRLLYRIALDMSITSALANVMMLYMQRAMKHNVACENEKTKISHIIMNLNDLLFQEKIHGIINDNINASEKEYIFQLQSPFFYEEMDKICRYDANGQMLGIISLIVTNTFEESDKENKKEKNLEKIKKKLKADVKKENEFAVEPYIHAVESLYSDIKKMQRLRLKCMKDKKESEKELRKYAKKQTELEFIIRQCLDAEILEKSRHSLFDGFSEAICDIYIFNLLDISFVQYLHYLVPLIETYCPMENKKEYLEGLDCFLVRLGVLIDIYGSIEKERWLTENLKKWEETSTVEDAPIYSSVIQTYYNRYRRTYGPYRHMMKQYLRHLSPQELQRNVKKSYNNSEIYLIWSDTISFIRTEFQKSLKVNTDESPFALNIEMIELFRYQPSVRNIRKRLERNNNDEIFIEDIDFDNAINRTNKNTQSEENDSNSNVGLDKYILIYDSVADIGDYYEKIIEKINAFGDNKKTSIWFRGVSNTAYDLRPNIFRRMDMVNGSANGKQRYSPYGYIVENLKKLHERTAAYPEIWDLRSNTVSQIAILQHYGGGTNFLDFSLDALTSLHFAVNPEEERDKTANADAIVYIVHPKLFNEQMDWYFKLESEWAHYPMYCSNVLSEENCYGYIPTDFSDKEVNRMSSLYFELLDNKTNRRSVELQNLIVPPRTLIVPQNNNRIKVQMGTFIAFPLFMEPHIICDENGCGGDPFEYMCLRKLQEAVLREGGKRFMDQVVIRAESIPKLRSQLTNLGMKTSRVYPELKEIIKDM